MWNKLKLLKPNYIIILPWNLKEEIQKELEFVKKWNCKFILAEPKLTNE